MENINPFGEHWEKLLETPKEEIQLFCANLLFFLMAEEQMARGEEFKVRLGEDRIHLGDKRIIAKREDIAKVHRDDRMLLFLYESIEANYIKNNVTKVINGEEYYTSYYAYMNYLHREIPDELFPNPQKSYSDEEKIEIVANFKKAKELITGYVNPREVIEYFYSTKLGREFLPPSLIEYLDDKQKANTVNTSEAIPMPYNPPPTTPKSTNRSGSKINPEKHARTKEACQRAWEKVQKESILDLNKDSFSEIATSFLGQGESLNTTVARAFYKDEVSKEYKAGRGRKSK